MMAIPLVESVEKGQRTCELMGALCSKISPQQLHSATCSSSSVIMAAIHTSSFFAHSYVMTTRLCTGRCLLMVISELTISWSNGSQVIMAAGWSAGS